MSEWRSYGSGDGMFPDRPDYVFTGSYQIKILAVLTSLPKLEALARKLL